jgi:hypothetical protein
MGQGEDGLQDGHKMDKMGYRSLSLGEDEFGMHFAHSVHFSRG